MSVRSLSNANYEMEKGLASGSYCLLKGSSKAWTTSRSVSYGVQFYHPTSTIFIISKFPPETLDGAVLDLNFAKGMQGKVRYSSFGAVTGTFSKNQEPLYIAAEAREILQPVNAE